MAKAMTKNPSDTFLDDILRSTRVIACVGISANPVRPSFFVGRYLHLRDYRVIPVNPGYAGQTLFGETVHADLGSIPADINVDMVDIFRKPAAVPAIVDDALASLGDHLRTIWMQVGIEHGTAARVAEGRGLRVVQNRCPKIEHQRLYGELRKAGFNTGIISSRL